jgi:iron complex outermembrane receptor protein
MAATYLSGTKKHNAFVTFGRQIDDGYRQHNHDLRRYLTASMQFYPSQQEKATLLISHSRQEAHIPGALTAQQVAANPRQAVNENVKKETGRFQSWTRIGASHLYDFSDRFSNQTSVYSYFYNLHHPLDFAVIMQPYQSYGGRTRFKLQENVAGTPLDLSFGGEYQKAISDPRYFVNNGGQTGHLFLSQKLKNTRYFLF